MGDDVDSDEDLAKVLEPLAYYVSDRRRVLREALKTLKGKRLEAMIPPVLKSWERPRLEAACLNILEDIDDETLLSILDGRAGTVNVAAVEQPEQAEPVKETKTKKLKNKLKKTKSLEAVVSEEPKKKKKKKAIATEENLEDAKATKMKKKKKLLKAKKIKEKLKKKKKAAAAAAVTAVDGEPSAAAPHKSLMELLELEYRAKAIKALLKSQGQTVPDIPLNVEGEEEAAGETLLTAEAVKEEPKTAAAQVTPKKISQPTRPKPNSIRATPSPTKTNKPVPSIIPSPKKSISSAQSSQSVSTTTVKPCPIKQNQEPKKKAVIDLIDDALNTSFSEITDSQLDGSNMRPPVGIMETCASSKDAGAEKDLRSKLVKKYQKLETQKTTTTVVAVENNVVKKKRRKKEPNQPHDEEEDILDLHPQELSLTDEDHGGGNTNEENESSVEEEEEEEEEIDSETENKSVVEKPEEVIQVPAATTTETQEEELIYDGTDEEEETIENVDTLGDKIEMEGDSSSNLSNQEDRLWATVKEGTKVKEDIGLVQADETANTVNDSNDASQVEGLGPPRRKILDENMREGVFESASIGIGNAKGKSTGTSFGKNLLQRKLTLRIDPARIEALKEESAKEEAKRTEERKRLEEEERLKRLEEEPEEGEIDSNEENNISDEGGDVKKNNFELDRKRDRQISNLPTPTTQKVIPKKDTRSVGSDGSDCDSEDSQNSSSYYGRRRPYKRKAASPNRDFGKYSPERTAEDSSKKNDEESSRKRPTSPVDFITQFSDMEDISDEDSNHSQPKSQQRKKVGPVQGCAQKPLDAASSSEDEQMKVTSTNANNVTEDLKKGSEDSQDASSSKPDDGAGEESEAEENEDEDELPKPITWYERWAQSHGMSKVVKANKIHRKVKSKLKQVKSATKKLPEVPKVPEPSVEAEPIIGSIEEYEKLFGKKVIVKSSEKDDEDSKSNSAVQQDDDEEEDADDLWGDIIGGS